jgi:hypothetical protein
MSSSARVVAGSLQLSCSTVDSQLQLIRARTVWKTPFLTALLLLLVCRRAVTTQRTASLVKLSRHVTILISILMFCILLCSVDNQSVRDRQKQSREITIWLATVARDPNGVPLEHNQEKYRRSANERRV